MDDDYEDIAPAPKNNKVLIVNLSSIHELKYYITVLSAIAKLDPSYPKNLPALARDYVLGRFNDLIKDYKLGQQSTEDFLDYACHYLHTDDKEALKTAWNYLIDFNDNPSANCCFWACPTLSCEQKFQKLLDYARDNDYDSIYFISNTNPLNVQKIITYLQEKFPRVIDTHANTRLEPLQEVPEDNKDIKISSIDTTLNIYLSLSYIYHQFKTPTQNHTRESVITTPQLLHSLIHSLQDKKITVISQFQGDLTAARHKNIEAIDAKEFYRRDNSIEKTSLPDQHRENDKQPLLTS